MSVDLHKLVEVKDKEGKWHLVTWHPELQDDYKDEHWIWKGLSFRDYFVNNYDKMGYSVPDDISEETKKVLAEEPNHPSYFCMDYSELCDIANTTFERVWGSLITAMNKRISDSQQASIIAILKALSKISKPEETEKIAAKALKEAKKEAFEYDDDCEYEPLEYLKEDFYDYEGMVQELNTIRVLVEAFTGEYWIDAENIRVIMYML